MTVTKAKFDPYIALIHTQYVELCSADTAHQRAAEAADLISVCIQLIDDLQYDPVEVYKKRTEEKLDDFVAIVRRYNEKIKPILAKIKEFEEA